MSRRSLSPTELVVNFFMKSALTEAEQALLVATAIVAARKQPVIAPTRSAPRGFAGSSRRSAIPIWTRAAASKS